MKTNQDERDCEAINVEKIVRNRRRVEGVLNTFVVTVKPTPRRRHHSYKNQED